MKERAFRDINPARYASAAADTYEGRRVVAVVGIDRYQSWPNLRNAVSDARGVLQSFRRLGFEQITEPLFDE